MFSVKRFFKCLLSQFNMLASLSCQDRYLTVADIKDAQEVQVKSIVKNSVNKKIIYLKFKIDLLKIYFKLLHPCSSRPTPAEESALLA